MKRLAIAAILLAASLALADKVLGTATSTSAVITHGDWLRLADAGFRYTVCGHATVSGGAKVYHFPNPDAGTEWVGPCEPCEPAAWNSAPATCSAQWKTNRGL